MNVRQRLEEAQISRQFGFGSLALWATLGFLLEAAHALKVSRYLDHPLRRELATWAHAHGVGLSLVVLAYAAVGIHAGLSSSAGLRLRIGTLLLPAGFLLGIVGHTESDPGPAIFAVPLGAVLVIWSLFEVALAARGDE